MSTQKTVPATRNQVNWLVLREFEKIGVGDYCTFVVEEDGSDELLLTVITRDGELVFGSWDDYVVLVATVQQYITHQHDWNLPVGVSLGTFFVVLGKRLVGEKLEDFEELFYPPVELPVLTVEPGVYDFSVVEQLAQLVGFVGDDTNLKVVTTRNGVRVYTECYGFFHHIMEDWEEVTETNVAEYVQALEDVQRLNPLMEDVEDSESYFWRITMVASRLFAARQRGIRPGFYEVRKVTQNMFPLTGELFN